jgi:hypothetical protein
VSGMHNNAKLSSYYEGKDFVIHEFSKEFDDEGKRFCVPHHLFHIRNFDDDVKYLEPDGSHFLELRIRYDPYY